MSKIQVIRSQFQGEGCVLFFEASWPAHNTLCPKVFHPVLHLRSQQDLVRFDLRKESAECRASPLILESY